MTLNTMHLFYLDKTSFPIIHQVNMDRSGTHMYHANVSISKQASEITFQAPFIECHVTNYNLLWRELRVLFVTFPSWQEEKEMCHILNFIFSYDWFYLGLHNTPSHGRDNRLSILWLLHNHWQMEWQMAQERHLHVFVRALHQENVWQ